MVLDVNANEPDFVKIVIFSESPVHLQTTETSIKLRDGRVTRLHKFYNAQCTNIVLTSSKDPDKSGSDIRLFVT